MRREPRTRRRRATGRPFSTPSSRPLSALLLSTLATTLLVGLFTAVVGGGTAEAAAYRFWGFYQWKKSAWTFATVGANAVKPADGTVEGWRLAVSGEGSPRVPRADGDFDQICAGTPKAAGKKRVAVVLDYGLAEEEPSGTTPPAPRGDCASVDTAASSAQVLAAVAQVRTSKSLVCGIDGFPAAGCGDQVDKAPAVASPEPAVQLALPAAATEPDKSETPKASEPAAAEDTDDTSGGIPLVPVAGAAVVVVLVVAGLMMRRRRAADQDG